MHCSIPTTRPAIFLPSSLAALTSFGTAEAAILVILMELVFVARMALGLISAANDANMACFKGRDSDTAYATNLSQYISPTRPSVKRRAIPQ